MKPIRSWKGERILTQDQHSPDLHPVWRLLILRIWDSLEFEPAKVSVRRAAPTDKKGRTDIELPPLHVLAGIFIGNDNDELGDFSIFHPFVQLAHDLFDVCLDLVVGGNCTKSAFVSFTH